eukprot:gene13275-17788_t
MLPVDTTEEGKHFSQPFDNNRILSSDQLDIRLGSLSATTSDSKFRRPIPFGVVSKLSATTNAGKMHCSVRAMKNHTLQKSYVLQNSKKSSKNSSWFSQADLPPVTYEELVPNNDSNLSAVSMQSNTSANYNGFSAQNDNSNASNEYFRDELSNQSTEFPNKNQQTSAYHNNNFYTSKKQNKNTLIRMTEPDSCWKPTVRFMASPEVRSFSISNGNTFDEPTPSQCFHSNLGKVTSLVCTPDGCYCIVAFSSGVIRLFDMTKASQSDNDHHIGIDLLAFDTSLNFCTIHLAMHHHNFNKPNGFCHILAGVGSGSTQFSILDIFSLIAAKKRRGFITSNGGGLHIFNKFDSQLKGLCASKIVSFGEDQTFVDSCEYHATYRLVTGKGSGSFNIWEVKLSAKVAIAPGINRIVSSGNIDYKQEWRMITSGKINGPRLAFAHFIMITSSDNANPINENHTAQLSLQPIELLMAATDKSTRRVILDANESLSSHSEAKNISQIYVTSENGHILFCGSEELIIIKYNSFSQIIVSKQSLSLNQYQYNNIYNDLTEEFNSNVLNSKRGTLSNRHLRQIENICCTSDGNYALVTCSDNTILLYSKCSLFAKELRVVNGSSVVNKDDENIDDNDEEGSVGILFQFDEKYKIQASICYVNSCNDAIVDDSRYCLCESGCFNHHFSPEFVQITLSWWLISNPSAGTTIKSCRLVLNDPKLITSSVQINSNLFTSNSSSAINNVNNSHNKFTLQSKYGKSCMYHIVPHSYTIGSYSTDNNSLICCENCGDITTKHLCLIQNEESNNSESQNNSSLLGVVTEDDEENNMEQSEDDDSSVNSSGDEKDNHKRSSSIQSNSIKKKRRQSSSKDEKELDKKDNNNNSLFSQVVSKSKSNSSITNSKSSSTITISTAEYNNMKSLLDFRAKRLRSSFDQIYNLRQQINRDLSKADEKMHKDAFAMNNLKKENSELIKKVEKSQKLESYVSEVEALLSENQRKLLPVKYHDNDNLTSSPSLTHTNCIFSGKKCVICLNHNANVVMVSCGHICLCYEDAIMMSNKRLLGKCLICTLPCSGFQKINGL